MWKEKFEKAKALVVKKTEGNNKKTIENLVVFAIILIITIIAINVIWKGDSKDKTGEEEDNTKVLAKQLSSEEISSVGIRNQNELEKKLEEILSKIAGAGKVSVLITYSESSQIVPVYNENNTESKTEETDKQGGTRKVEENTVQKEIIYKETSGEKEPITQKVISPKIEGAIVIAEGADQIEVKTNIMQAVEAVTGIATHKIQVFSSQKTN